MSLSISQIKADLLKFVSNRQTWGFIVSLGIFAVISLAFFFPDNFEGNDLRQHDMVQGMANGEEIRAFAEQTGEQSFWTNSLFSGMPTFQIAPTYPSNSLFGWFTKVYGGFLPSPSNLLFMMMAGFMILMMTMRVRWEYGVIGAIAWGLSTYFIIIIGAGHIWKFVTLAYIPPTIGGIILAYRGRYLAGGAMAAFFAMMQLNANHIQMTYYFGFVILALVIGYLIKAVRDKGMRRWIKGTATLVIAAALAVCANLPSLYHTSKYAKETQREMSEVSMSGTETAAQADSARRAWILQYSYGKAETFTLMIPNVKGGASVAPKDAGLQFLSLAGMEGATKYSNDPFVDLYLNYSSQYFGEPESTNGPVYVGVIICALFIIGCIVVRGPIKWAMVAVLIITIFLSWGRNMGWFSDLFIDMVPMYSKFRTVESILVVAEFIIPLLAIYGLYKLYNPDEKLQPTTATGARGPKFMTTKTDRAIVIGFGIVGLICLLGTVSPGIFGDGYNPQAEAQTSEMIRYSLLQQGYGEDIVSKVSIYNPAVRQAVEELRLSLVRDDSIRSLIFLILGAGAMAVWRFNLMGKKKVSTYMSVAFIGALVFIDLYTVNKRYINHESFHEEDFVSTFTKSEVIEPTAADELILQDTDPNFRVMDFDRFTSAEPSYFHKMIGGYHAAKLGRYNDLINAGLITSEPVLNMLNARYIVAQGQVYPNELALGNAWFVNNVNYVDNATDELNALATIDPANEAVANREMQKILGEAGAGSPEDYIVETSYAPNKLTYKSVTSSPRVAVFSEIYFPWGWEATIDGKPADIAQVNYVLRGMVIPAGEHEIVMTFDPKSVHATTTVATIAVILIYITVILAIAAALFGCCKCCGKKE